MAEALAESLLAEHQLAVADRKNWDSLWQDVADLVVPARQFTVTRETGSRITTRIFNATAPKAAVTLASGLHGMLMNPSIRWFEWFPVDPTDELGHVWLHDTTSRMLAYFNDPESGFPTASYELALDQVAFGTAINQVVEPMRRSDIMRFVARRLVNFYLTEDEEGRVWKVSRQAEFTATDIVRLFRLPTDRIPDVVRTAALDPKKAGEKRDVIHIIRKRDDADPLSPTNTNKAWASFYVDEKAKFLIREGGFDENPYLTPRYAKTPEETYGRGPGIDALPDIRMANAISRTMIQAGELSARPPIAAIANSIEGNITTRPGALWWIKRGTTQLPQAINTGSNMTAIFAMLQGVERSIDQAFFADVLRLPTAEPGQGQPRMTAEEVSTRVQQGLLLTSPATSRQFVEWLMPAVFRVFNWMFRTNRLAPAPPSMRGRRMSVRFTGPMALAQRGSEARSFLDGISAAAPLIELDPRIMARNLDMDTAFRKLMLGSNVDPTFLRREEEVAQIRQQEQEAQAAAEQAQLAETAGGAARQFAGAAKDVSNAA